LLIKPPAEYREKSLSLEVVLLIRNSQFSREKEIGMCPKIGVQLAR
jgi:hypothetical protein